MSLTDDWNAGKLKCGKSFFIKLKNGEIEIAKLQHHDTFEYYDLFGTCIILAPDFDKIEVLAPCDYDHFVELTEKAKKYDRIKINGNYPDKISKLKSRIKHLLELQANQDKEVENLRELLKECLAHLSLGEIGTSVTPINILITHINAALGDNEIQANPVANIKIQESKKQ